MTQTPAAWYPDPQQPGMQRYWDGIQWTEHRAPLGPSTADSLARAGSDLADGVANAFTSAGNWLNRQTAPQQSTAPTFLQIAAGCLDDAPKEPLSRAVEALVGPAEVDPVRRVFAEHNLAITAAGASLQQPVRLVPNPWNPADPGAVAVLVRAHQVAMLPADVAAEYSPALIALSQRRLLAVGLGTLWAQYDGATVTARVSLQLPEVAALA